MFSDLEIRILVCKKDIEMCTNMIFSLQQYDEFKNVPIYLHEDGSMDNESIAVLSKIENVYIVSKQNSDNLILEHIKGNKYCEKYRLENSRTNLWHKIKLFDFYFFSNSKNILCIDTDILFINKPKNIIDLINKSIPFYFPDFQNSYSFSKNTKTNVLENVNTGIFYIPSKDYYHINEIEFALNDLFMMGISNTPNWIEQSAYSHMFYKDGRYVKLDEQKNKIPKTIEDISNDVESLHFVSHPPIRELYNSFLKKEYL